MMYIGDRQPARSVAFAATRSSGTPREKQFPSSKNRNMRKRNITLVTAIAAAVAFAPTAQAALTIPEPSAALLLGVAGMGLLVRRRRA